MVVSLTHANTHRREGFRSVSTWGDGDGSGKATPHVIDFGRRDIWVTLGRALRLRCPRCGVSPLYAGRFRMHEACAACGLRYEREMGYFVGAIYLNYAATAAVTVATVLLLDGLFDLSLAVELAIGVALAILVPLVFFRYSRSLWLGLDYLVTLADDRQERRRYRRRAG